MILTEDWGLIDYKEAELRQLEYVEQIAKKTRGDTLVFCTHPPVVTLGRSTQEGDVFAWEGNTFSVGRGGRATYHGPNQLVCYPLILLQAEHRNKLPSRDVHAYLRGLEKAVIETLSEYGLSAHAGNNNVDVMTGVWVGDKKLASIGIGVKKWVTYHGLAINMDEDPNAFKGLKPCGFTTETMTSIEELLQYKPKRKILQGQLEQRIVDFLT